MEKVSVSGPFLVGVFGHFRSQIGIFWMETGIIGRCFRLPLASTRVARTIAFSTVHNIGNTAKTSQNLSFTLSKRLGER